ncbi:50S ribosomal protein L3 [Patescibacteria group bacterium]|nr:50S ribosomal protein L3 [Patescibacteria group bacterium]MBU1895774.1 50S ribosomal protein L3 [Patescibacteria group bacterium]
MKFILGTKLGMTQVFREDGIVVPVTRVKAGPCVITQVKTQKKDGINAVQVGYGEQKKFRLNKPKQGHLKDLATVRFTRDFKIEEGHDLKRGDEYTVKVFEPGDKIQVTGHSKGRGFQGVVKRHGFHGHPASHGHKDQERMPGSIGATDAARVFKGTRMGGQMGNTQVTIKNLEVIEIHPEDNELLIKGAVPGARGGLLLIANETGKMEIIVEKEVTEKTKVEVLTDFENSDTKVEEEGVEVQEENEKKEVVEKPEEKVAEEKIEEVKKEKIEEKKETEE